MKFILSLAIALFLLIISVAGLSPAILSTAWGRSMLVSGINRFSNYSIKIDLLELSWSGKQALAEIELSDKSGKLIFRCDALSTDATLFQILGRRDFGHMKVTAPKMRIEAPISRSDITLLDDRRVKSKTSTHLKLSQTLEAGVMPTLTIMRPSYSGDLTVEDGEIDFLTPGLDPIKLQNLSLSLNIPKRAPVQVKSQGETIQANILGQFDIEGILDDKIEIKAHLVNFPTRVIDQSLSINGLATAAIGDALNIDLEAKGTQEVLNISLDANAPNFKATVQTTSNNHTVSLSSPALINFTVNPEFAAKFAEVSLLKPVTVALKIDDLRLFLPKNEIFAIQGSLNVSDIELPETLIQSTTLSLSTDDAKESKFTASILSPQLSISAMHFQCKDGASLLSPVSFSGVVNGSLTKLFVPLRFQDLELEAEIDWQGKARLSIATLKSVTIDYTISNLPSPLPPLLSQPATIRVKFDPITSFDVFKGTASAHSLALQGINLQNIQIPFVINRKDRSGSFRLSGNVEGGTLDTQLSLKEGNFHAFGNLKKFPIHFFEIVLQQNNLQAALGDVVDLSFDIAAKKDTLQASMHGSSDLLKLNLALEQSGDTVSLTQPALISYTLTREGYKTLDQWFNKTPGPFELESDTKLNLSLTDLKLPIIPGPNGIPRLLFDMAKIQLQGDLTVDRLSFFEKLTRQTQSLHHLKLHLAQSTMNAPLSFDLQADVEPKGSLTLSGTFDHATASTAIELNIAQFPSSVLDLAARCIGKEEISASAIFGPSVNGAATAAIQNWTGPIKININAPSSRASLDGTLKDGMLTLNDTIYAQIMMTPSLSHLILKDINPLSTSAIRAGHPLTLEIPATGFNVKLHPFSMSEVTIPNIRIELGQIVCQNEGNLSTALALLKLSQFSNEKELKLWFAPIDLHINKGVVDCERTEVLVADTFDICTWGQVDLVKDYVDMVLGLTSSCLKKAFGIKDLPSEYVLQIPMKGPTNDVQIDSGKATAKVAALLLWQQKSIAGNIAKGPAGAFIGELVKKLGPLPDFNAKAPAAKHPFPWESSPEEASKKKHTSDSEPHKKKTHFKSNDKPLKQLLKILK